jgi:hypothetical protein
MPTYLINLGSRTLVTLKELRLLPGATNAPRHATLHGLSSADCAHKLELVARTWDHRNAELHDTFRSGPPEISEPASGARRSAFLEPTSAIALRPTS